MTICHCTIPVVNISFAGENGGPVRARDIECGKIAHKGSVINKIVFFFLKKKKKRGEKNKGLKVIWSHRCGHFDGGGNVMECASRAQLREPRFTFPVFPCFYIPSRVNFHKGEHSFTCHPHRSN